MTQALNLLFVSKPMVCGKLYIYCAIFLIKAESTDKGKGQFILTCQKNKKLIQE